MGSIYKLKDRMIVWKTIDYLNAGMGEPCAGQLIENIRLAITLNAPRVSEDVGNIGLEDPIGSVIWLIIIGFDNTTELSMTCAVQETEEQKKNLDWYFWWIMNIEM